jgi:hypothetical protein
VPDDRRMKKLSPRPCRASAAHSGFGPVPLHPAPKKAMTARTPPPSLSIAQV